MSHSRVSLFPYSESLLTFPKEEILRDWWYIVNNEQKPKRCPTSFGPYARNDSNTTSTTQGHDDVTRRDDARGWHDEEGWRVPVPTSTPSCGVFLFCFLFHSYCWNNASRSESQTHYSAHLSIAHYLFSIPILHCSPCYPFVRTKPLLTTNGFVFLFFATHLLWPSSFKAIVIKDSFFCMKYLSTLPSQILR